MNKLFQFKKKHLSSKNFFFEEDGSSYSYNDLLKLSNNIVESIPTRSVILLKSYNTFIWLSAYFGLIRKNIIPILLEPNIDKNYEKDLISRYKPSYIFSRYEEKYKKFNTVFKKNKFHVFKTNYETKNIKVNKSLCLLLTTSGTTGHKKFVKLSYENLYSNTFAIIDYLKIKKSDALITTLQPSYSYGLSLLNSHLQVGSTIIFNDYSFIDKKFWNLFTKYKPTTFACVPKSLEFLSRLNIKKINFKNIKYITLAGGSLETAKLLDIYKALFKKNIRLYTMYGQTEASPRISYLDPKFNKSKIGSIGKPIKGGKLFLVDKKNKTIKHTNKIGELNYKGKNVFIGYSYSYKDLIKNKTNKNNILKTGDYGYKDKQGFYWLVGRKKDFIKINSYRVNLKELNDFFKFSGFQSHCTFLNNKINIYYENRKFVSFFKKSPIIKGNLSITNFCLIFKKKIPVNERGKINIKELTEK